MVPGTTVGAKTLYRSANPNPYRHDVTLNVSRVRDTVTGRDEWLQYWYQAGTGIWGNEKSSSYLLLDKQILQFHDHLAIFEFSTILYTFDTDKWK